jgi:acylphosphatase
MRAANIRVTGKVQGVFFRESVKEMADNLGLNGFVRNEPDDSVYIEVEGEEAQIEKLAAWCKEGPEHAEVKEVKVTRQPLNDYEGFRVEIGK